MAKKDTGSAKKSAIPYTPEVTPKPTKAAQPNDKSAKAEKSAKTVAAPATTPSPVVTPKVLTQQTETTATPPAAPKAAPAPAKREAPPLTWEIISERAYFIAISGTGGDEMGNWLRAEAELKREAEEG